MILKQIYIVSAFLLIVINSSPAYSGKIIQSQDYLNIVQLWLKKSNTYQTTNSQIYLDNLNTNIVVLEKLYKKTKHTQHGVLLANNWYLRYRIIGDFNDASNALALITKIQITNNLSQDQLYIYATILSGFHQFKEALNILYSIEKKTGRTKKTSIFINEIHFSLGSYQSKEHALKSSISTLTRANYALLNNNIDKANKFYKQLLLNYNDTDPYKYVWLQLQQGIALLRYGQYQSAQLLFQNAHKRFPKYYLVTEHLAETELLLGHYKKAQILYRQVSQQTNNPEFLAQLAKVEKHLNNQTLSRIAQKKAQTGFDTLVDKFPMAIGDHAIEFYLDNNQNIRALKLAISNFENRKNIESYVLLINTAVANKNIDLACETYKQSQLLQVKPIELINTSNSLKRQCAQLGIKYL